MTYIKLIWRKATGMTAFTKELLFLIYILETCLSTVVMRFLMVLKRVIDFIENFGFSDADIDYLKQ